MVYGKDEFHKTVMDKSCEMNTVQTFVVVTHKRCEQCLKQLLVARNPKLALLQVCVEMYVALVACCLTPGLQDKCF